MNSGMGPTKDRRKQVKHLVTALLVTMAGALVQSAAAQSQDIAVPIVKASYHVPVFKNEYVTLLNVYVPPGRNTGYHTHTLDGVSTTIKDADMTNQDFGAPRPGPARRSQRGSVNYSDFRKQSRSHKASNVGSTPFHTVSFMFNSSEAGRFTPSSRSGAAGYEQVLDNPRVRGWRLVLEPGQSAGSITQGSPGIRIVVEGGELMESVPGQPDRAMNPKLGDFLWQDAGTTRVIRNIGKTRLELVEFELK
jgi:hypothetical protein